MDSKAETVLTTELLDEGIRILREPAYLHLELLPPYDPYGTWPLAISLVLETQAKEGLLVEDSQPDVLSST